MQKAIKSLPDEVQARGVNVARRSSEILGFLQAISRNGTHDRNFLNNYVQNNIKNIKAIISHFLHKIHSFTKYNKQKIPCFKIIKTRDSIKYTIDNHNCEKLKRQIILFQDKQYQEEFCLLGILEKHHHLLKRGSFGLLG